LLPPPWLRSADLEITSYPAGSSWSRCHNTGEHPIFFGPGVGNLPRHRFDAPDGEYQVLYVGLNYEAAFVETLLRNPSRKIVDVVDLENRSIEILQNDNSISLVRAHGSGLSRMGTTAELVTMPYEDSRMWSLDLWHHYSEPDGLVYFSRHNPEHFCAAMFKRSHCTFSVSQTTPLLDDPRRVRDLLEKHGKSLT
jgi:hypothetical protein